MQTWSRISVVIWERFESLSISAEHMPQAGLLPAHRPFRPHFGRKQAQAENVPIVSADVAFDSYKVRRICEFGNRCTSGCGHTSVI
jgi:hypothetical protein